MFPIPCGIGGITGPPLRKNAPVHNGRVPPSLWEKPSVSSGLSRHCPGQFGKAHGAWLSMQSGIKTLLPPFLSGGNFCVSHSLRDCEEKQDHPSEKMRRCITGEPALAERKISCALRVVPPSLRAVWKSPWGLVFSCNPEYKTLLPPFLSPAGAGMKKQRR